MDEVRERLVFEAGGVPRRELSQRRITGKCCLIIAAVLGAIIWIPILFLIGKFTHGFVQDIRSPYSSYASKEGNVNPLINSTSQFDVLATVWLDVTHHLKQGHSLPEEYKVVHYKQHNGEERSEAIIHTGILFENASMASRLHSTTEIRFPVEPLYTQPMGFSTIRGTIQLVPHSPPASLLFHSSDLIYPKHLPIGPRSLDSYLLKGGDRPSTLNEALERSAVNINLIKLFPTKWRLNDTDPNFRVDFGEDPPLLDGAPSNRQFARKGIEEVLVDFSHRLRVPHIQTRSRVTLIKEEQKFDLPVYNGRRFGWVSTYENDCKQFKNGSSEVISDGKCQRQSKSSLFENKLQFSSEEEGVPNQTFYAPYLAQSVSASAYRHLRTIPRFSPLSITHNSTLEPASTDQCLIPMLETDDSNRFFTFNWDVFFSSHEHFRGTSAENFYQHHFPAMEDFRDNGTEIRARALFAESLNWNLIATGFGDREHPKSKPWLSAFRLALIVSWHIFAQVFGALYWYTRATSQGISSKSLWMSLAAASIDMIRNITTFTKESIFSFSILLELFSIACIVVPAYLQLSSLLHFDINRTSGIIRRKANKKERDSRRLDNEIKWLLPIGLALVQFILLRYTTSFEKHVISPQGCQDTGEEDDESITTVRLILHQLIEALSNAGILTQLLFNIQSKTYAGSFKFVAISSAIVQSFFLIFEQVESLSGWQSTRFPLLVSESYQLVLGLVTAFQAVFYPGIPQVVADNNEDDMELM